MPAARRSEAAQAQQEAARRASEQEQKTAIEEVLRETKGVVSIAARNLGFARSHMNRLLDKYELRAWAADLRTEAGAGTLRSGARAGITGLGRPSKNGPRRGTF